MFNEKEIINIILGELPENKFHYNNFFESDSEMLLLWGKKMLVTIDEFSPEDFFRDDDPYKLGWNVAAGTLSDILACGGNPLFFGHSMMIDSEKWDTEYIKSFSQGISDVLKKSGAGFMGGDLGKSNQWRYTGVALGESQRILSRRGAESGNIIFITGHVGAGNLEAALKLFPDKVTREEELGKFKMQLPLRLKESQLIREFATSCIDSSDGVLNALNTIADINNTGYIVRNIPYLQEGIEVCKFLSIPETLLFIGECGEYELIFTIKNEDKDAFIKRSKEEQLLFHRIGEIAEKQQRTLFTTKNRIDFCRFNINARDYTEIRDYLSELIKYVISNEK